MDFFLIHCLILTWATLATARRLCAHPLDQLLAAGLVASANLVVTSLVLSALHRLGEPAWFLGISTALALLTGLVAQRCPPDTPEPEGTGPSPIWRNLFMLSIGAAAVASGIAAWFHEAYNAEALAQQLPRAMFYLGQGHLSPATLPDPQRAGLPFNYDLLMLFGLVYGPPLPCLNFFNLLAWLAGGLAVYRICRLSQLNANASLGAAWFALATTPVLAQAPATTPEIFIGIALLGAALFLLRWQRTRRVSDAWLGGLAAGLAAGSNLGALGLVLASVMILAVLNYRSGARYSAAAWLGVLLMIATLGLPFLVVNGVSFVAMTWHPAGWPEVTSLLGGLAPLLQKPPLLVVLDEDSIGLGPAGGLSLLCMLVVFTRHRQSTGWFAAAAFGWLVASVCLKSILPLHARAWLPALWLLGPCVAAVLQAASHRAVAAVLAAFFLLTGWSAGAYLLHNSNRPLAHLAIVAQAPALSSTLPLRLVHRLAAQPRVAFDTDGTGERVFPLMAVRPAQRWTARPAAAAGSYQLVSRGAPGRAAHVAELLPKSTHMLAALPAKRTAGVEYLATLGEGRAARDYFGIPPGDDLGESTESNRNLLFLLDPTATQLRLLGLNAPDQIRVEASLEANDGTVTRLASFTADGTAALPPGGNFRRILLAAFDADNGFPIEFAEATVGSPDDVSVEGVGRNSARDPLSLFVTELVPPQPNANVREQGLQPVEGPFPQWNLPAVRWARQPEVRLSVLPVPQLARLRLSFSLRLHVRKMAELELRFNGTPVQRYRLEDQTTWLNETVELTPSPGTNVIEFRDLPLAKQPDWLEYLERYPDVRLHVLSHNLPLEAGAREHYELSGKAEGRTVKLIDPPKLEPDAYYFLFRSIQVEGFRSP